jgi:hypothetical protein
MALWAPERQFLFLHIRDKRTAYQYNYLPFFTSLGMIELSEKSGKTLSIFFIFTHAVS